MAGTISSLGVGSGLELNSILEQLREVDNRIVEIKQGQITEFEAKLEEFSVVQNKLFDMKSHALDLSLESSFMKRTGSVSNEQVVTADVADGATVRSVALNVTALASKSSWLSAGVSATDTSVNDQGSDQAFSYKVGETSVSIVVEDGTTLTELADLINDDDDNPGVTATIINDGDPDTPYRLSLQADETGEDNRIIELAWLPDLAMTEQEGVGGDSLNAEFTVDGISYQRQSNTSDDVMAGVTLTLHDTGSSSVTVGKNDEALQKSIVGLVDTYNEVVQEVQSNVAYNAEKGDFGVLARTTLRDLPYALQNMMTTSYAARQDLITRTYDEDDGTLTTTDKNIYSMFDLGLEYNSDGTISIDENVLSTAISQNKEGVEAFFLGDEDNDITGFGDLVNTQLRSYTSGTGLIEGEKNGTEERIDELGLQIETETERLDKKYEQMTQQFVALDRYMNQMTSISNYLTSQFDSLGSMLSGNK